MQSLKRVVSDQMSCELKTSVRNILNNNILIAGVSYKVIAF